MPPSVTLKLVQGKLDRPEWVFAERTTCLIGRAEDCNLRIPEFHRQVSRYHCLLDINPPDIRIRDFGSLNGTIVNQRLIGQRESQTRSLVVRDRDRQEYDIQHGEEIVLGDMTFLVEKFVPLKCVDCHAELAAASQSSPADSPDSARCESCQQRRSRPAQPTYRPQCSVCRRSLPAQENNAVRLGDEICEVCRAQPLVLLNLLLNLAKTGRQDLASIEGYKVVRELGKGGFGAVYLALHEQTGEQVALKVMLPKVAADGEASNRFLREMDNSRALHHPHIVEAREGGCCRGTFFLTLEYCEQGSLDHLLRIRGGKLSVDESCAIMLQVLDGLAYAHQATIPNVRLKDGTYRPGKGLVHRDLKPQNIFLTRDSQAKIGDFGLSKSFDLAGLCGQTRTGAQVGTPRFMPRIQALDFKCSQPEVDVWAAAATLYFLLTGQSPRNFAKKLDIWDELLRQSAVPIRERDKAIPPKLAEVIDAALVEVPRIGFQSAAEFKAALERVL